MYDLHTHTRYSHGTSTPEENVQAALALGLSSIAISEHAPAHVFYGVRGEKLAALRREVDRLKEKYAGRIEVLMGIECDLTGFGTCDLPQDVPFDVKLLAFHKGVLPTDGFSRRRTLECLGLYKAEPALTADALLLACERYKIDILSHPSLYVKADVPRLAAGAKELGVKLELNGRRVSMSEEELRLAKATGVSFVLGSDAHDGKTVGDFTAGLLAAREAGITELANLTEFHRRT